MYAKKCDKTCDTLLLFFVAHNRRYGFNELFRILNKHGIKISRPTLANHLRHLVGNNILTRKEEEKQRVFYELNWNFFKTLTAARPNNKTLELQFENKKKMESLSTEEQLSFVANVLKLKTVSLLKLKILSTLEPEKQFYYHVESLMLGKYYDSFVTWLLDAVKNDPQKFKEVGLAHLDATIQGLYEEAFEK